VTGARPSEGRLYFLLFLMLVFWSLNYVIGKFALREFPPLLLACLRTTFSGLFVLPIYLARRKGVRGDWKWPELRGLLVLGVAGLVLNQVLFVIGLSWTSVAHASIVVVLMPVMVLLFSVFLGQEHFTIGKTLGIIVAAAGVLVLQLSKDQSSGATIYGDLFIFMSGIALAAYTVKSKQLANRYDTLTINSIAYVGGALALAPTTLWLSFGFNFTRASALGWASLAYMSAFAGVLSYLIYNYALQYIPASRVSAFSYLQPLGATLFAVFLLGELITASLVIGGILVLAGVFITERV